MGISRTRRQQIKTAEDYHATLAQGAASPMQAVPAVAARTVARKPEAPVVRVPTVRTPIARKPEAPVVRVSTVRAPIARKPEAPVVRVSTVRAPVAVKKPAGSGKEKYLAIFRQLSVSVQADWGQWYKDHWNTLTKEQQLSAMRRAEARLAQEQGGKVKQKVGPPVAAVRQPQPPKQPLPPRPRSLLLRSGKVVRQPRGSVIG